MDQHPDPPSVEANDFLSQVIRIAYPCRVFRLGTQTWGGK